ncbi:MAG TPA: TolC family protein [Allosphingosinicella sp.]|jgi:multidrug efflux system outer membrane protein|nr:TolC family protein [Allosphingosinicella sp.]
MTIASIRTGWKGIALILLVAALAPAQAGKPRPAGPPGPAIPERFNAAERYPAATVPAASVADEAWWKIFADPALDRIVEKARTSNSSIYEAAARLEKSRALLRGAAAARMPQLGGNGGVSQRTGPLINESGQSGRLIYPNASVSYEVDLLGRLSKAKTAARLDAAASADLLRHARLLVEADTVQTYFEICALDEERSILARAADDQGATLRILEERERNGLATRLAVNRSRAEIATVRSDIDDLDRRRAELASNLALLMGEAPSDIPVAGRLGTPPIIPSDIPSAVIARRPDISAGLRSVEAARARVGGAKVSWLPSLSLTGAQGFASPSLGDLLSSATQNFGLGFLFSIPGLDGGRHKARVRSARADLSLASAEYGTQLLTALRDVDNQLSVVRILGDRAATLRSIADDDEVLATMLHARYANGLISQLDYVDGLRVVLDHRRTAVQVNVARYVATIGLIRALGGGWGAAPTAPDRLAKSDPPPQPGR